MINDLKEIWNLLWYGGIAFGLLCLLILIIRGHLIPRIHHAAIVEHLTKALESVTKDRDEWRDHAGTLHDAIDRLAEAVNLRGRR